MGEKKNVFLTKHQRKGNKNPVLFKLNSMWVEKKIRPIKKAPTKKRSLRLLHYRNFKTIKTMDNCKQKD